MNITKDNIELAFTSNIKKAKIFFFNTNNNPAVDKYIIKNKTILLSNLFVKKKNIYSICISIIMLIFWYVLAVLSSDLRPPLNVTP